MLFFAAAADARRASVIPTAVMLFLPLRHATYERAISLLIRL